MIQKDTTKLCSLYAGAGFGELALINEAPRSASVIAELKSELIRIDKVDYDRFAPS
jgi:CRP-like cAMP-binding protein